MKNWKNPSEFQDCLCTASSKPICLWFLSPLLYTNCTQVTWLDSKKKSVFCVWPKKTCILWLPWFRSDIKKLSIGLPKNNNNVTQTYGSKGK